ncbi:amidase [Vibrio phage D81]
MQPKHITVHTSATPPSAKITVNEIRQMHLNKGWSDIGYHFVITRDGILQVGRPLSRNGAHVKGHNKDNIGICLVGGVDKNGKAENNFNDKQFEALRYLISELSGRYGIKEESIKGHRDWFTDINGDGIVDSRDWLKECPCFDVKSKLLEWAS